MSNFLYGIDFGTSNSAVSILDVEQDKIIKTISIPSVLYFPQKKYGFETDPVFTGKEAILAYVNDGMKGRFMKSIKRILPRSTFIDTTINGNKYGASDLASFILKDLKKKADEFIGQECTKAVIGRPVFFDDDDTQKDELAQKRLQKAAEYAGFVDIRFQLEPIAAAFAYEKSIKTKQRVLVGDLGGGTTDFTFIELDPNKIKNLNRRADITATGGIYIGGDSFDSTFMLKRGIKYFGKNAKYAIKPNQFLNLPMSLFVNITTWERMNFFNSAKIMFEINKYYFFSKNDPTIKNLITLIEKNLGYVLFQEIEKTKIELSTSSKTDFTFMKDEIVIQEEVSQPDYADIISSDINKIDTYLDKFLETNKIDLNTIDSIFLTGGTSMVDSVQQLFKQKFGETQIHSGDNFISVANGLAYSGYLFDAENT